MAEIDTYFKALVDAGGSDLHLQQGRKPKLRVHGGVHIIDELPELTGELLERMFKEICPDRLWPAFLSDAPDGGGDCDFAYSMDEHSRFRCNFHRQHTGLAAIFRIIPTKIMTLEQLGIPPVIKRFADLRSGLVLVTGPTGSGKSTTLAALIDYINTNYNKHVITVEEPIEFVHKSKGCVITQREVPENAASFADGLRASLREDAEIVLVGEMRDLETTSLALSAAETGMLVFGTLHTNSARKTIDRLIDVFPASQQAQVRTMLSSSLKGVVAQLLCKRHDKPGRKAVNEIMFANSAVASIIREGKTQKLTDVIVAGKSEGMQFMDDAIWEALVAGIISPEEAYMKANDKDRFENFLPEDQKDLAAVAGV